MRLIALVGLVWWTVAAMIVAVGLALAQVALLVALYVPAGIYAGLGCARDDGWSGWLTWPVWVLAAVGLQAYRWACFAGQAWGNLWRGEPVALIDPLAREGLR